MHVLGSFLHLRAAVQYGKEQRERLCGRGLAAGNACDWSQNVWWILVFDPEQPQIPS